MFVIAFCIEIPIKQFSLVTTSIRVHITHSEQYNTRVASKYKNKSQLVTLPAHLAELEAKWSCNVLRLDWGSIPPELLYYGWF